MFRTSLLTAVAAIALMGALPARAEDAAMQAAPQAQEQTAFSQAIKAIKGWFGPNAPQPAAAAQTTDTAAADDTIQIPPHVAPQAIEPAAGMDEDLLQVPPPYTGPQSNAAPMGGPDRATAFDGTPSMAAFGDAQSQQPAVAAAQSAADIANIAPAAGEGAEADMSQVDCKAVLKAADAGTEGEAAPDTAVVEACAVPQTEPVTTSPAQPGFEPMPQALPETQPASGEPPIGGATMPGMPELPAPAEAAQ